MFSHVQIGTSDFPRAYGFYAPIMAALGLELRFNEPEVPWAAWQRPGQDRPIFILGAPFEGAHHPGNGQMVAFIAPDRDTVRRCHALALAAGGTDAGAPGPRPQYHADYYGAYFRDLDGNKICVACHAAP